MKIRGAAILRILFALFSVFIVAVVLSPTCAVYGATGIAVIAANGGEVWGGTQSITWTVAGAVLGDTVDLEYSSDGGGTWKNIANNLNALVQTSYPWDTTALPAPDRYGTNFLIRATVTGPFSDTSDAVFSVSNPIINVTLPDGGEVWSGIQNITWTETGVHPNDTIKVQYSSNGAGGPWTNIAPGIPPGTLTQSWNTTLVPYGTNYFIKVVVVRAGADFPPGDTSNAAFSVSNPTVAVTSPNGGEFWSGTRNITWTEVDVHQNDTIKAQYSLNGVGGPWTNIAAGIPKGTLTQSWNTAAAGGDGTNFSVKVVVVRGGADLKEDSSDGAFTVDNTPPGINQIQPADINPSSGTSPIYLRSQPLPSPSAITVTATDPPNGSNLQEIKYNFDVDSDAGSTPLNAGGNPSFTTNFSVAAGLLEGSPPHKLYYWSLDRAGNNSTHRSLDFIIDNTPPGVTNPQPTNGSFRNDNPLTISATVMDGGSGIDASSITVKANGVQVPHTYSSNTISATIQQEGSYQITIDVRDNIGNSTPANLATWSFTLDRTRPTLILDDITSYVISTQKSPFLLKGRTDPNTQILINGTPLLPGAELDPTGRFERAVPLSPGANTIVVQARSRATNVSEVRLLLTYEASMVSSSSVSAENVTSFLATPQGGVTGESYDKKLSLYVPPMAVSQDTIISIVPRALQTLPPVPENYLLLSRVYDLLPSKTNFQRPLTLRMTFEAGREGEYDSQAIGLYYYDEDQRKWIKEAGALETQNLRHFTMFAVMAEKVREEKK